MKRKAEDIMVGSITKGMRRNQQRSFRDALFGALNCESLYSPILRIHMHDRSIRNGL